MKVKTAEEFLADEIELYSVGRFMDVVEDLKLCIKSGILCQTGGSIKIELISDQTELTQINMTFKSIPGETEYFIDYHGRGVFSKGSQLEFAERQKRN